MGDVYQDQLVTLKELKKFKVAEGDVDVRGWRVTSSDGIRIGKIAELVVDRNAMKVRYLDVKLNSDIFDREVDRHVLIPVGIARVSRDSERVLLQDVTASELLTLPPYAPGPITRDYERTLRDNLTSATGRAESTEEGFYDHNHFDSDRFYARREESTATSREPDDYNRDEPLPPPDETYSNRR